MYEAKETVKDIKIDLSMTMDNCCEKDCGIPILVDKDLKDQGRKSRCTACMMRFNTA